MTRDLRLGPAGFKCCCYEDSDRSAAEGILTKRQGRDARQPGAQRRESRRSAKGATRDNIAARTAMPWRRAGDFSPRSLRIGLAAPILRARQREWPIALSRSLDCWRCPVALPFQSRSRGGVCGGTGRRSWAPLLAAPATPRPVRRLCTTCAPLGGTTYRGACTVPKHNLLTPSSGVSAA